ncbi:F-box/kelch-repeat protein At3g23880-like [Lotus japonicus]|uniref:F-box/kelch-repeat protein At3g23880-like n=1 Tax=Lotus japonicus TaxID=34305 RepID=UPI0025898BEB|nr:F-box/kelch-repeat protein At3g23880-like [Lotus japonicus]
MAIPDDVAFTILSKLPLKSLKRFTLVHKSWADLLEIPYFMTMLCSKLVSKHQSYYDDTSLLLLKQKLDGTQCHGTLYSLSGDKLEKTLKSDWLPYQEHGRFHSVSGSGIHGILCLHEAPDREFVLWNPATQEFIATPPSPRESLPDLEAYSKITTHGFGYDHVTDDFKIVRLITYYPDNDNDNDNDDDDDRQDEDGDEPMIPEPLWEIYSLKSNYWRKLDVDMPIITGDGAGMGCDIYMNGVCHWVGYNLSKDYGFDTHLVSFNFSKEIFYTTPLPLDDRKVQNYLAVLNESIALISKHEETTTLDIWILGELRVKESWTKLFTVGLGPLHGFGVPIGVGKTGDIFFRNKNGELGLFDLRTQMLKEIAATELVDHDQIIFYKESFFPIGRTGY